MQKNIELRTALFLVVLIILSYAAMAVPVNYETTSVSRIVGDGPSDMRRQLFTSGFTLQDADLFTQRGFATQYDIQRVMSSQFPSMNVLPQFRDWRFSDVEDQLSNGQNNYLVLNSQTANTPYSTVQGIIADVNDWQFTEKNIFVFDSQYAGLHIPSRTSFTSKLSSKAPYIAPLSYPSPQFVKSLVCNLGKHTKIAEAFRQARNNYYVNTNLRSEFLGLTLLSYGLYGAPTTNVLIPDWNTPAQRRLCGDYDETFGIQSTVQIQQNALNKQVTVSIGDPTIQNYDDFTIIETQNTQSKYAEDELIVPFKTEIIRFPLDTVITSVTLIGFEDPVDLTAPNTPMWNGDSMEEKTCYSETASASAEFSYAVTEEQVLVVAHINPVDILSCSQGSFRVYKTARYQIDYTPNSPVLITGVEHPETMTPNQTINIQVEIENIQLEPVTGILALVGEDGVISTVEVTSTQTTYQLEFTAPEEGLHNYRIEFVQENESKTFDEFEIDVEVLDAQLIIPEIVGQSAAVTLEITNMLSETITATINDVLTHDEQTISSNEQEVQLPPGTTTITLTYNGLEKDAISYDLLVNIAYLDTNKLLWGTIITDHAPTILQGNVILHEGDTVQITPETDDLDGDEVSMTIDSQLPLDGSYTLTYEDSGVYTISIEASDGIITIGKTISLTVENVNRPPTLAVPETITVSEGQEISIGAIASDPDNQNSVNNDDNTLTIAYSSPFDSNGEYTPSYDASGEFTTLVSVSDGEFTDTKTVKITIINANRPPHLNDLTDITIKEGEWVYGQKGRDPDNENIDPSDDNNITHRYFNVPLDHEGKWKTTYDNSGLYDLKVEVSDGDLGTTKTVKLTVENVNRPPVITAPEIIEAQGSVDLSVYITDPDNTNTATNDDNILTVTYGGSPFDANGVWSPTIPDSTAYTTITVSEGEFTVSKNIYVHVAEINVQPQQTPAQAPVPTAPQPVQSEDPPVTTEEEPVEEVEEVFSTEPTVEEEIATPETNVPPEQIPLQPATQPNPPAQTGTWGAQPQTSTQETVEQPEELEVEVKVRRKQVDDGDSVQVKPDNEFKVKVDVKNNAEQEKDVDIEVSIDDLDQEEEDSTTLDPDDSEDFTYEFDIPRITDDDEYDLDIFVKDGTQTKKWNILLKIDKPTHEIIITQFSLTPVTCGQISSQARIQLANTGKNDEDGTMHIEGVQDIPFELTEGEERQYTQTLTRLTPGVHPVTITVDYGKQTVQQTEQLTVEACKQEETAIVNAEPEQEQVVIQTGQKEAKPVSLQSEGIPSKDIISIAFVILSTLFAVTLIIFAIRLGRQY